MTCVFALSDKAYMCSWHVAFPGLWAAHSVGLELHRRGNG